jgi:hypothetical protein
MASSFEYNFQGYRRLMAADGAEAVGPFLGRK